MNTQTISMRSAATPISSGFAALSARGYCLGATELVLTGEVRLQVISPNQDSFWGGSGFAAAGAGLTGQPSAVRPISDFSKPRYGSQASDGSG
ncbi:hypothetical protein [Kineosporia succinea]|uniref:Uncharacterized protein n=1 Tax=Kineosporia succinea TaxID=84632 RepID=A0ABT9P3X3_9ACTN|nr:hypothetical protein [Kineosporia succinea]MDP9827377.1 hypothetical protein [Kineosporia succinea]